MLNLVSLLLHDPLVKSKKIHVFFYEMDKAIRLEIHFTLCKFKPKYPAAYILISIDWNK